MSTSQILKFWKPYDVLTQFTDAQGRPTLADYIRIPNVYAAGRLDRDSEGLLLLTDDDKLKTRLTEPRYAHPRTYWVQVERIPDESALSKLRHGLELGDGPTKPTIVKRLDKAPDVPLREPPIRVRQTVADCWLQLTLTEGRNRQVRRMTAAVGHPTLRLVRCAIGNITLKGLEPGKWQALSDAEADELRRSVKLK
jgi:pseudouridine synthase